MKWNVEKLTDSHCHNTHLSSEEWTGVQQRAHEAGVENLILISTDHDELIKTRTLAGEDYGMSFGMHPHKAREYDFEQWEQWFGSENYHVIGECGLDYHYEHSPSDVQKKVFDHQLKMATKFKKNVVVHIRDAFEDAIAFIQECSRKGILGVVHCFTGIPDQVKPILDIGWMIGFTGIVTFGKKAQSICEAVKICPLDQLLIETDSPYLAPDPFRGKQNEPSYLVYIAQKIAELKNVSMQQLIEKTTANTKRLIGD